MHERLKYLLYRRCSEGCMTPTVYKPFMTTDINLHKQSEMLIIPTLSWRMLLNVKLTLHQSYTNDISSMTLCWYDNLTRKASTSHYVTKTPRNTSVHVYKVCCPNTRLSFLWEMCQSTWTNVIQFDYSSFYKRCWSKCL